MIGPPRAGTNTYTVTERAHQVEQPLNAAASLEQFAARTEPTSKNRAPSVENRNYGLLTPEDAAEQLKVSAEHVRALIRSGRLEAINLAIGKKRPLYRIAAKALEGFLADRCGSTTPQRSLPHFKRLPPVEDHFPHLH